MSTAQDLTALTLKELRQLAGEHQIKNRSRLSKQELITALQDQLGAGGAPPTEATPRGKAEDKGQDQGESGGEDRSRAKPSSKPVHDEPEVLDPAAIAALTGEADADDRSEPQGERSGDAEGDEDGGRKRRRRRRRGRGRGKKKGNGDDGDQASEAEGQPDTEAPKERGGRDEASAAAKPEAEAGPQRPKREDRDESASKRDQERDRGRGRSEDEAKPAVEAEAKPKPPQLSGQQRKLPPVLDRLQTFTAGILELCDPDTPAWAQARLSELLADAGVAPIPCHGRPHDRFHEIVGTTSSGDVPDGHIAVIEAPGFALRGDRGDLFPLRKAKVLIAGDGKARKPSADRDTAATSEPAGARGGPAGAQGGKEAGQAEPAAPVAEADAPAAQADSPAPAPEPAASGDEPRSRGGRERRPRSRRAAPAETDDDDSEAAIDPSSHANGPVLDEPEPQAPGRATKVAPAEEAPHLPLQPQEAEELAARPKAEGWRGLGLHEQILADLQDVGFEQPTDIQAQAIGIAMSGRDLIGQSQTGSGKTAAFLLPTLHRLYEIEGACPAALVLCPTRELARQVHAAFISFAGKSGARAALIYGGVGMAEQFQALARHPHVVIGTPGRIIDHARRKTLDLSNLAVCILDEADQMLDIGFLPDIEWVLKHTPPKRQMLLFSATMPDEIRKLASKHMHDPDTIHIAPKQVTVDQVDQKFIAVDPDKKTALLAHFIETYRPEQMVVFCNTKHQTDRVANVLKRKKLSAQAIHGDLPQAKREKTLNAFRDGSLNCLIATNVAARGLDIPSVSHVVNYDIPSNPEEYVHRVGRTARMGRKGVARTFVTPEDGQFVVEIEKHIGLLLDEEVVEGMQASTAEKPKRSTVTANSGPRLLKPLVGGIRLGRGRRR